MPPTRLYLDANATEPLRPSARAALLEALELGNPSSVHAEGRRARSALEAARATLGRALGLVPQALTFCSGATEANSMVLRAAQARGERILASAIEHDSVRFAVEGVEEVPVLPSGQPDLAALERMLAASERPALVAILAAHNETGIVQDLAAIGEVVRAHRARLHCDATQAPGRIHLDPALAQADTIALSGHKAGAGKGAGLLLAPRGEAPEALLRGGGQERGRRAGTEALPAILALAAALPEALRREDAERLARMRDAIEAGIARAHAASVVVGQGQERLPNTSCLALPGRAAATQVIALDLGGIAVSAGSACSSGKVAASRSLLAMGLGALAGEAIRVSLPWNTPDDAAERFLDAYLQRVQAAVTA